MEFNKEALKKKIEEMKKKFDDWADVNPKRKDEDFINRNQRKQIEHLEKRGH
jgi:hypothetical protein